MEDIAGDIANCEADKLSTLKKLETHKMRDNWELIYRTIKNESEEQSFIIQALGQKLLEEETLNADEFNIRKPISMPQN